MNCALSTLDLNRFGVVTAKADLIESPDQVTECLAFCETNRAKLLIARIDSHRLDLAHRLEFDGAILCDTLIYYELRMLKAEKYQNFSDEFAVRLIQQNDKEAVLSIAREAFSGYYGHYHSDPRLKKSDCDDTYVSWCEKTINNVGNVHGVLVIEDASGICGFLTVRVHEDERLELVLSGIAKQYSGRGVYRRLIQSGVGYAREIGIKRVFTSTQLPNLAVQRVWIAQNFIPIKSTHTFHLWL
ncbi:GNAT family N-acetyltransferase [Burkholderia sp. S171]|uniref:GNAT family N-acetyltransferase n=1 Tax=Burkholderia sp. S171 TaxID=1641860 RepID=UPI00131A654B|nr:GNAT family N-acetyltransferase [Burkholderia sp. S171]